MVKAVIIVPARMQASRFPGKMLAPLAGRPVVAYTVQAACAVAGVETVFVATDDALIAEAARTAGVRPLMTDPASRNGTERVAQAYAALTAEGLQADVIINLQGDAPLTPAWVVEDIIAAFSDPAVSVATPVVRCTCLLYTSDAADE